jgi:hypothetical protein
MKKVLDFYEKIIGWLEIALNLLIVGVIGLQIITRFFFNLPLKFPEEVSAFALIAMVFVGVSVVERHNEHLRVEFLQDLLPTKGKKAMNIVSRLLTLVLTGHFGGRISAFPANQDAKNSCGPNSLCVVTHCNYCFYNPVGNFCCAGTAE